MHVVDPSTSRVLPVDRVVEMIDAQYDNLKDLYEDTGIKTLEPASTSNKGRLFLLFILSIRHNELILIMLMFTVNSVVKYYLILIICR